MNVTGISYYNQSELINNGTSRNYTPLIPAIMFGTGVFGNCLALFVLASSSAEQKRTVFYRLVAGLALTDLFGIVATSPVTLAVYANDLTWIGGQPLCDYFSFVMIFAGFDTVFIVGAMAMDRYLALTHPYLYSANISHKKVKYIIIVLIIIAFVLACLPLIGVGKNVIQYPGTWCFFDFKGTRVSDKIYSYIYASIGVLMILLLTFTNIVVIGILIRMRRTTDAAEKKCMEKEVQMMIFLAGVVMIFTACWAPLMVSPIYPTFISINNVSPRKQTFIS
ncbi:hypothetical protein KUTeg_014741 [Tegillarca granosa]|uniref:G-protein coupled receptors family 1 profile domain-containing protein n=1 Tax=Tegillarca granosa TaxID=220873 RepID=A0ABQ9EWH1_TEGGR|nr:hypothetical protein KUTeg_014741 [Tegillarca granosa]